MCSHSVTSMKYEKGRIILYSVPRIDGTQSPCQPLPFSKTSHMMGRLVMKNCCRNVWLSLLSFILKTILFFWRINRIYRCFPYRSWIIPFFSSTNSKRWCPKDGHRCPPFAIIFKHPEMRIPNPTPPWHHGGNGTTHWPRSVVGISWFSSKNICCTVFSSTSIPSATWCSTLIRSA